MTMTAREASVLQPAHQINQMDLRQVRDVAGIRYLEAGPAAGVPLLFLHGVGGVARAFAAQLDHFGSRYRVIAWDMPGYAGSAPLPLVTMEALAAALAGFILALGLERPVLVGHGLGGMVALRLLAGQPKAARAVVLAQTGVSGCTERAVQARLGPLDAGQSLAEIARALVRAEVGRDADPAGVALAEDCLADVPDSTYRDMIGVAAGFDDRSTLPGIAVPALVLTNDATAAAQLADAIPGSRRAVIEGAGRLTFLERPSEFNAAVAAFLDDVTAGEGRG